MSSITFETGDLVIILLDEYAGSVGIVTRRITKGHKGHVLIHEDGDIIGLEVSIRDVASADESSEGFAQLGYQLIKLGSHVIEQKLIVYRS